MMTHSFELIKEHEIPELNSRARLFRHHKTGAQLLSVENQDENKVFGITLRTPPNDSTGIAHIMEHSVLCGSQKYPLKKPFVELLKGSLNTFLNAFTYPDKTCYPVASQNLKDFYNLIDVYVDAVFHPLIPPATLQQEGWRYELEQPDQPLIYKGVVFNEMKGAYSNPDDVLQDQARMSLFPDTPYGVDAGGDPRHIPDLTYAQFKDFHNHYYHPSNSLIYFYGDDDPKARLERMNAYLEEFERIEVDSAIPLQPAFRTPQRCEIAYDPGGEQDSLKGMLVVNWLLGEASDAKTMLGLNILAHILVGTPASPLRKALIDSGMGEDLAGVGLEDELRQAYFSTGLKGMQAKPGGDLVAATQLETLILDTLRQLGEQGIDPEMVAASLNTVEFRLRENNTGSFPRGLLLMLRALTSWLYDHDPVMPLAFAEPLAWIKDQVAEGKPYFEDLIRQRFLNNPHRTTVILKPQPGLQKQRDDEERQRLTAVHKALSEPELQQISAQTRHLKELQERPDPPEALARIPSLKLGDLDRQNKLIPLEVSEAAGSKLLYHDIFTNGIVYLDIGFDLHTLSQELLPYVPLFGRALLETGTETADYVRLSQRIGRSTGGIWAAPFTSPIRGASQGAARLFMRSKATPAQTGELLAILTEVLLTARLDHHERFRQIALEEKASREAMLVPAGHGVVNTRLRSLFNEADWAAEQMGGVSQLFFLRELIKRIDSDWQIVQEQLETVRRILVDRRNLIVNVTLDAANWRTFKPMLSEFLEGLPESGSVRAAWQPQPQAQFEGLAIPAQVNYVGKGANLFELGYTADGSVDVITNYLRTTWLWERIRVQGGAYGGFCLFNNRSGVFTYISYRDPNLLRTLDNYDQAARFLTELDLDTDELTKSIIGAIGDMDAYQLPDAKGYASMLRYLAGDTDENRQAWREQILSSSPEDFHTLGQALSRLNEAGYVTVMGSSEALAQANAARPGWLKLNQVL